MSDELDWPVVAVDVLASQSNITECTYQRMNHTDCSALRHADYEIGLGQAC